MREENGLNWMEVVVRLHRKWFNLIKRRKSQDNGGMCFNLVFLKLLSFVLNQLLIEKCQKLGFRRK